MTHARPPHITIELVNICNLHCGYCVRDDDALHHQKATYLALDFLRRVLTEAQALGFSQVSFTGGEATLHPQFGEILGLLEELDFRCSFITNASLFERVWPTICLHQKTVGHIAFSLDGATAETHDRWRGKGSFERVIKAFTLCHFHQVPFSVKVALRRDSVPQLESIALLVARLGADQLHYMHFMPTDQQFEAEQMLTLAERKRAETEVAELAKIFKMPIGVDIGYVNLDPAPPCEALQGRSPNIDYSGRLTLCCNLSGYRGGIGNSDVVADLHRTSLAKAQQQLQFLAEAQLARRRRALLDQETAKQDIYTGSPCLFCLKSFDKIPWKTKAQAAH